MTLHDWEKMVKPLENLSMLRLKQAETMERFFKTILHEIIKENSQLKQEIKTLNERKDHETDV